MNESNESRLFLLQMGRAFPDTVLFRNNVGMGWQGQVIDQPDPTIKVLKNPRPLHAGLIKGSGDLIGWTNIVITADMVGKTVAVFTSVENKKAKGGTIKDAQQNWHDNINRSGGIAIFAMSPELGVDAFGKHPLILTR